MNLLPDLTRLNPNQKNSFNLIINYLTIYFKKFNIIYIHLFIYLFTYYF
jgi:hypothetical protein